MWAQTKFDLSAGSAIQEVGVGIMVPATSCIAMAGFELAHSKTNNALGFLGEIGLYSDHTNPFLSGAVQIGSLDSKFAVGLKCDLNFGTQQKKFFYSFGVHTLKAGDIEEISLNFGIHLTP